MSQQIAVLLAAACVSSAGVAAPASSVAVRCGADTVAAGDVQRVVDGRTLVLADGREVRLAAIEAPPLPSGAETVAVAAGAAARDALAAIVSGQRIDLKRPGKADAAHTDRYGRLVGHAVIVRAGVERSVAAEMLAGGHARVAARVGDAACAAALLAHERAARKAKLGLWADPYYVMRQAEKPAEILSERGRFTLVEGKVLSVRESGGTIYVNFGRRWSEDFTVTIPRRNERAFADAGLAPKQLSGRLVRVRGFVEERGGPWIEAVRPEQIELADRN